MNLSAPTKPVFMIALILGVLAIVGTFIAIPVVSANAFWMLVVAFVILAAGNLMKGM